jgi:hypothetical protein
MLLHALSKPAHNRANAEPEKVRRLRDINITPPGAIVSGPLTANQ